MTAIISKCGKYRYRLDRQIGMDGPVSSGKPVLHFGTTNSGDPKHPLMLGYDTTLVSWGCDEAAAAMAPEEAE